MYLQMLPIQQRALGPGHADTIDTMNGLAATYQQQGRLPDAEKLYQQVLEIQRQAEEPQALAEAAIQLGGCWLRAGKFAEAETMLRTGLGLRIEHSPEHWRRFQAESLLGAALLGQKSLAAAEPLLRSGYAGLYARADAIPDESKHQLRDAIERLAQFAEVAGDVAQVAEWRQRMVEFDHARQVADR